MVYDGSCHCGAIRIRLTSFSAPEVALVRACDCSFCRAHNARTVTDPSGLVEISFEDLAKVHRYRFGLRTADYLVCRHCGVYVAAMARTDSGLRATVNVNALEERALFDAQPPPVSYEGETAETRIARRGERWTPAAIVGRNKNSKGERLFHIAYSRDWDGSQVTYEPDGLSRTGFIHCSLSDQIMRTANEKFKGTPGLLVLMIDSERVQSEIRYENLKGGDQLFPHIYGPLNIDAILAVESLHLKKDGSFETPDCLKGTTWRDPKRQLPR